MRTKTFSLGRLTPEDAVSEMELLDHEFHLFIDAVTGRDAVVWRKPDGGYALMRALKSREPPESTGVELSDVEPPRVHLTEAVERLNMTGDPFVFFVDAMSGRGNVVYRRYDGNYGVIAPAEPLPQARQ